MYKVTFKKKRQLEGKQGLLQLTLWGDNHGRKGVVSRMWGSWTRIVYSQETERWKLPPSLLSTLYSVWDPAHGMVDLRTLVNPV